MLSLEFHIEDPDGVKDTFNIFLFPNLSLSDRSEVALVTRRWDTDLGSRMLTT